jgi:hypothetical protein
VSGEVPGDGNPDNDLDPAVSRYLAQLVHDTNFLEIFITDDRGFVIAAVGPPAISTRAGRLAALLYWYQVRDQTNVPGPAAKAGIKPVTNPTTDSMSAM